MTGGRTACNWRRKRVRGGEVILSLLAQLRHYVRPYRTGLGTHLHAVAAGQRQRPIILEDPIVMHSRCSRVDAAHSCDAHNLLQLKVL